MELYLCFIISNTNPRNKLTFIDLIYEEQLKLKNTIHFGNCKNGKIIRVFKIKLNHEMLKTNRIVLIKDDPKLLLTSATNSIFENDEDIMSKINSIMCRKITYGELSSISYDGRKTLGREKLFQYYDAMDNLEIEIKSLILHLKKLIDIKHGEKLKVINEIWGNKSDLSIYCYDEKTTFVETIVRFKCEKFSEKYETTLLNVCLDYHTYFFNIVNTLCTDKLRISPIVNDNVRSYYKLIGNILEKDNYSMKYSFNHCSIHQFIQKRNIMIKDIDCFIRCLENNLDVLYIDSIEEIKILDDD